MLFKQASKQKTLVVAEGSLAGKLRTTLSMFERFLRGVRSTQQTVIDLS